MPHQLVMTATPIPRTLAMSAYADLDVSVIDEMPPGRTPVHTVAISGARRDEVVERIRLACAEGRQVYWVCTLIEESEDARPAAHASRRRPRRRPTRRLSLALPELRVGLLHGRMKPAEKQAVMARFKAGELHLLVATTVIEVGVDVPNASLMVIENAERLGLAQLHQLRGRVGRGAAGLQLRAAVPAAAVGAGARAPGGDARDHRRLPDRREGPGAARAGRTAGHPPDRPGRASGSPTWCATPHLLPAVHRLAEALLADDAGAGRPGGGALGRQRGPFRGGLDSAQAGRRPGSG